MSFALAIRNTVSEARQAMLTTTSLIVIVTVITQGGAANYLLKFFQIQWVHSTYSLSLLLVHIHENVNDCLINNFDFECPHFQSRVFHFSIENINFKLNFEKNLS